MLRLSKVWLKLENSTKSDALPISSDETLMLMNKPFVYLLKQVFQFRIIEGTRVFRICTFLRGRKHDKE